MSPSTAASRHQGAVIPERRRPAMNVMVFQCPPGASSRYRRPPLALPYLRIKSVVALVSSRNTSFDTSQVFCHSRHASRATRMSSRSRSVANTVFFIAPALPTDETPDGCRVDTQAALGLKVRLHLLFAPVAVAADHFLDERGLFLKNRAAMTAHLQGGVIPTLPPLLHNARRRARRYI